MAPKVVRAPHVEARARDRTRHRVYPVMAPSGGLTELLTELAPMRLAARAVNVTRRHATGVPVTLGQTTSAVTETVDPVPTLDQVVMAHLVVAPDPQAPVAMVGRPAPGLEVMSVSNQTIETVDPVRHVTVPTVLPTRDATQGQTVTNVRLDAPMVLDHPVVLLVATHVTDVRTAPTPTDDRAPHHVGLEAVRVTDLALPRAGEEHRGPLVN